MRFPYALPLFLLPLLAIFPPSVTALNINPLSLLKRAFNFSYLPYTLVAVGGDGFTTTLTVSFTTIIYRDRPTTTRISTTKKTSTQNGVTSTIGSGCSRTTSTITKMRTITKHYTATVTKRCWRTVTKYVTRVSTVREVRTVTETVHVGWFEDVETVVVTEWV
ncbi:hypothetical protein TWF281_010273 [Arthrobotrys megalospora]